MNKIEAPVFQITGEQTGTVELPLRIFGVEIHRQLLLKALRRQMANRRLGTACTLTRAEVAGGGKKPWPQKGTGNARQGSRRSPLWPGGGITFGPRPRSVEISMPEKERRKAIFSALAEKSQAGAVLVCDLNGLEPKTKAVASALKNIGVSGKALLLLVADEEKYIRAGRNISQLKPILWQNMNVFDILNADQLILSPKALAKIEEVWGS